MMKKLVLTVASVLVLVKGQNCPDRSALNVVDARVHGYSNTAGNSYESINFHILDQYQTIDVTKANASVLCEGMIKKFFRLEFLSLINANISEIHENAFQELPRLLHLSLAVNNLTQIQQHYFKNLPTLKTLYLSSNKIAHIQDGAFDTLINLEKINLDRNEISAIAGGWFLRTPKIRKIDLTFNRIRHLPEAGFTLEKNSLVEIRLQHNLIEKLERNAVIPSKESTDDELPYLILHLEHNNLKEVPAEFIESMDKLHSNLVINSNYVDCLTPQAVELLRRTGVALHLVENPLSCDCMEYLNKYMNGNQILATFYYNTTIECELHNLRVPKYYFD